MLAAVAALMTSFYVTNYKRHVQRGEDHVTVLVAKHDIATGTSGSDVGGSLGTQEVPRRSVVPGAISSSGEIKDLVASQPTYAGEQVTSRRFASVAENGVRGQLTGTMRAFQLTGDQNQTLAGTLKTGDHVDFVAAVKFHRNNGDVVYGRVFLRNIKVLQGPGAPAAGSKLTGGVDQRFSTMLAVSDNQAQKLQLLLAATSDSSNGSGWHFELRPVLKDADSPDHVDSVFTVLRDGLSRSQRRVVGG